MWRALAGPRDALGPYAAHSLTRRIVLSFVAEDLRVCFSVSKGLTSRTRCRAEPSCSSTALSFSAYVRVHVRACMPACAFCTLREAWCLCTIYVMRMLVPHAYVHAVCGARAIVCPRAQVCSGRRACACVRSFSLRNLRASLVECTAARAKSAAFASHEGQCRSSVPVRGFSFHAPLTIDAGRRVPVVHCRRAAIGAAPVDLVGLIRRHRRSIAR